MASNRYMACDQSISSDESELSELESPETPEWDREPSSVVVDNTSDALISSQVSNENDSDSRDSAHTGHTDLMLALEIEDNPALLHRRRASIALNSHPFVPGSADNESPTSTGTVTEGSRAHSRNNASIRDENRHEHEHEADRRVDSTHCSPGNKNRVNATARFVELQNSSFSLTRSSRLLGPTSEDIDSSNEINDEWMADFDPPWVNTEERSPRWTAQTSDLARCITALRRASTSSKGTATPSSSTVKRVRFALSTDQDVAQSAIDAQAETGGDTTPDSPTIVTPAPPVRNLFHHLGGSADNTASNRVGNSPNLFQYARRSADNTASTRVGNAFRAISLRNRTLPIPRPSNVDRPSYVTWSLHAIRGSRVVRSLHRAATNARSSINRSRNPRQPAEANQQRDGISDGIQNATTTTTTTSATDPPPNQNLENDPHIAALAESLIHERPEQTASEPRTPFRVLRVCGYDEFEYNPHVPRISSWSRSRTQFTIREDRQGTTPAELWDRTGDMPMTSPLPMDADKENVDLRPLLDNSDEDDIGGQLTPTPLVPRGRLFGASPKRRPSLLFSNDPRLSERRHTSLFEDGDVDQNTTFAPDADPVDHDAMDTREYGTDADYTHATLYPRTYYPPAPTFTPGPPFAMNNLLEIRRASELTMRVALNTSPTPAPRPAEGRRRRSTTATTTTTSSSSTLNVTPLNATPAQTSSTDQPMEDAPTVATNSEPRPVRRSTRTRRPPPRFSL